MLYKVAADVIVLIHFLWIIFLLFGALWGVRNRIVKIIHLSGLLFAIVIQVFGWYCPLTHLEFWLRSKHNPTLIYGGSFIIHYLEKLVYLQISMTMVLIFTIFLCMFSLWIYLGKGSKTR